MPGYRATEKNSWVPTRKWMAAVVTSIAALATAWAQAGWEWSDTLSVMAIGVAAQALVSYLVPNGSYATGTGVKPRST